MGRATVALASRASSAGRNGTAVVVPTVVADDKPAVNGQELVPAAQTGGPAAEMVDRVQLVPAGVLNASNAADEELMEILHGVRNENRRGAWIVGDVGLALHLRVPGWKPGLPYDKGVLARIGLEAEVSETTARHAVHCAASFPLAARRMGLSITVHHEVIGLPPANRDGLLDEAFNRTLTCGQVRALVVKAKKAIAAEEEAKRLAAAPPAASDGAETTGGTGDTPAATDVSAAGTTENAPTENSPAGGTDTAPAADDTPEKATRVRTVEIEPAYMHALPAELFARIVSFFAACGMPNDAGMIGQCKAAHVVSTFVDMAVSGKLDRLDDVRTPELIGAHKAFAASVINTLARK